MAISRGVDAYSSLSRYTDPGTAVDLLRTLPDDVDGICLVAAAQTIHPNLRAALGVSSTINPRVWPPRLESVLETLRQREPHRLSSGRPKEHRVLGACILESHFLAGLLRHRGFSVRIRAGYFRNVRRDAAHIVAFWNGLSRWKGEPADDEYTMRKNAVDHHIEHWICELRDLGRWVLVDANTAFLREHSRMEVPPRLPPLYFEHAADAWHALSTDPTIPEDRYAEEPRSGREHVRRQLLLDFFSLLNHDVAEVDDVELPDERYDALADLLRDDPAIDELVAFYRGCTPLQLVAAVADPFSFVTSSPVR